MEGPDKYILVRVPVRKKVRLIDEFPVTLDTRNGFEVMVCSDCGYPIASVEGRRKSWYCPKCAKFKKGGSTNDVQWIRRKELIENGLG